MPISLEVGIFLSVHLEYAGIFIKGMLTRVKLSIIAVEEKSQNKTHKSIAVESGKWKESSCMLSRAVLISTILLVNACGTVQTKHGDSQNKKPSISSIHERIIADSLSKGVRTDKVVPFKEIADGTGPLKPVLFATPIYPLEAAKNRVEGWVMLVFTVDVEGSTANVQILENSGTDIFDKASIKAIEKFVYEPFIMDGEIVSVSGVTYKLTYQLGEGF